MHKARQQRLEAIIRLLESSDRGWTARELADRFCVTHRQMQRDLVEITGAPFYAPLVCRRRGAEYVHMDVAYQEGCQPKL